ncbi:prolyl oligopeptidase family serine peptidase [Lentisphaerota bacterium WC36G]|nr:prolyl oligopeptidase family serine peptidase [Lentisphaerae bacterium WC36]
MKLSCYLGLVLFTFTTLNVFSNVEKKESVNCSDIPKSNYPWNVKKLLQKPQFKWTASEKGVRSLIYKGERYKGKIVDVFAYYSTPGILTGDASKDKNLPAIVLVHGGEGAAFSRWAKIWASRGFAAIAIDLSGNGAKKVKLKNGGPELNHKNIFDMIEQPVTEQWPYHGVANVIKAHSLIRSFPEVDANRTAIMGISWGGYLTCISASLDHRFKAIASLYGCGFLYENSSWLEELNNLTPANRRKWINLWDPSQYVQSIKNPIFFVNGGTDLHFRTDSYARTYSLIKSKYKNIRYVPYLRHSHLFERPKEIEIFVNQFLNQGESLPKVTSVEIGEQEVKAHVKSEAKLLSANLYYTTNSYQGKIPFSRIANNSKQWEKNRKWIKLPAIIDGKLVKAVRPPLNEATAWFFTVTDERNSLISSEIMLSIGKREK